MSAVSMKVTPASSAAWIIAIASSRGGRCPSPFIETGMAPSPIADTVKGPIVRFCMPSVCQSHQSPEWLGARYAPETCCA